jgi:hypothetical protein
MPLHTALLFFMITTLPGDYSHFIEEKRVITCLVLGDKVDKRGTAPASPASGGVWLAPGLAL